MKGRSKHVFDVLRTVPLDEAVEAAYVVAHRIALGRPFPSADANTLNQLNDPVLEIKAEIEREEGAALPDIDLAIAERYIVKLAEVVEELTAKVTGFDPDVGRALLEQLRNNDGGAETRLASVASSIRSRTGSARPDLDYIWGALAPMVRSERIPDAVAHLYSSTRQFVLSRLRKALPPEATVQDPEDVLMKFYSEVVPELVSTFHPSVGRFEHYFNRALTNFLSRERRGIAAHARAETPLDADEVALVADGSSGPEEAANREEVTAILAACIRRLAPAYREVIDLYMDQMTESDIAARLGISSGTCRQRLRRAKAVLRDHLRAHGVTTYPIGELKHSADNRKLADDPGKSSG